MTRSLTRIVALGLLLVVGSTWILAQSRDVNPSRPISHGTGLITGQVVIDDVSAKPLRRVTVTLFDTAGLIPSRLAITDDAGRFTFRNLPTGRFGLSAARAPYLPTAYGAKRPTRPGAASTSTPISLADGQQLTGLTIKMPRGGVITGVIRDVSGQPAFGSSVGVAFFARSTTTGERTLTQYYGSSALTDDRGTYRLFGLPPGEYIISVSSSRLGDVAPTTDTDVLRALDLLSAPGTPAAASASIPLLRRPTIGVVPVFYPGTTVATEATPVVLEVGQERAGIDIQLQYVATARIDGTVKGPDGRPVAGVSVRPVLNAAGAMPGDLILFAGAASQVPSDAEGRFAVTGLTPGAYTLQARTMSFPGPGVPAQTVLWASSDVVVQGQDLTLDLTLAPAMTVRGRITLDGTSPAPDFTKVRVVFVPAASSAGAVSAGGTADADGAFTVPGVVPGKYRISAGLPAGSMLTPAWVVKSATVAGQNAADFPITIGAGQDGLEANVTLTDRIAELSGTMSDASGRPASDYFIIVFSADREFWAPMSRRILQTRPAQDGKFTFKNLPPGDYLLAAVTEVEQGQWFDPAFLAQLVDASAKVSLADSEKKVQDIRIR